MGDNLLPVVPRHQVTQTVHVGNPYVSRLRGVLEFCGFNFNNETFGLVCNYVIGYMTKLIGLATGPMRQALCWQVQ